MNTVISIQQAQDMLSTLVERAAHGETIFIGTPENAIAKLVGIEKVEKPKKIFGAMKGEFIVHDDFDAPLPDEILDAFEGH
ncbi:MAG: hypothetical protein QM709_12155 [Spongiibacteraceae bacterium]